MVIEVTDDEQKLLIRYRKLSKPIHREAVLLAIEDATLFLPEAGTESYSERPDETTFESGQSPQ